MKNPALTLLLGGFLLSPAAYAQNEPAAAESEFAKPPEEIVSVRIKTQDDTHWIKIRLDDRQAPKHCDNFRKLAGQNFYEGIAIHRVIPDYLVQMGDPLTRDESQKELWGTGGVGYNIPPEIGLRHRKGSVGMARLQSGNPKKLSSGCQFYIMLTDAPKLDKNYTVFGEVVEGLDVISDISRSHADTNNLPVHRVEITASKIGEPGLVAAMTAPIAGLPKPKMPEIKNPLSIIPNPLSIIPNPFHKKDRGGDDAEVLVEEENSGTVVVEEEVLGSPPPATGDERKKRSGPFGRLFKKFW